MPAPTLGIFKIQTNDNNGNSLFTYDGVTTELTFSDPISNSSGAFTYTSLNPNYATVTKGTPNRLVLGIPGEVGDPLGMTLITATQAASGSYTSISTVINFYYVKQLVAFTNVTPNSTTLVDDIEPVVLTQTFESVQDDSAVLTYTSSDITVASVGASSGVITCLKLGSTSITVTCNGTYSTGKLTFPFYVKSDYTLTAPTLPTVLAIGQTYNAVHPTNVNSAPFTYSSSFPEVATINSTGLITARTQVGTTTITVSQSSSTSYIAKSTSATLVVVNTNTLNVDPILPVTITPATVYPVVRELTNISNNDEEVTYSLVGTYAGITLTNDQLTIEEDSYIGSVTVQADQPATATVASKTVTITFEILKQTESILPFDLGDFKVGDTFPIPEIRKIDMDGGGDVTWTTSTPNTISITTESVDCNNVGAASLTVTIADTATYFGASYTYSFQVSKGLPIITLNLPPIYFEGTKTFPLNPISASDGTITYSTTTPNFVSFSDNNTFTLLRANGVQVYVTATQAATENYLANSVTSSFLVNIGASPSINVALNGSPFGSIPNTSVISSFPQQPCGELIELALSSVSTDGAFSVTTTTPSNISISGTKVRLTAIGDASVTVRQARGFFYESSYITFNFTIIRGTPSITFVVPTKRYDPLVPFELPAATSLSTGAFTYTTDTPDVISVNGTTVTMLKVGTANIIASLTSDVNYLSNTASSTFQIVKAVPVLSNFNDVVVVYSPNMVITSPATSSNTSTPIVFTTSDATVLAEFSGNQTTVLKSGICGVTAMQLETDNFEALPPTFIRIAVQKVTPTVGALTLPTDKKYGDDPFELTNPTSTQSETGFTFSSSNLLVATTNGTMVTIVGAGSAVITAVQTGNDKYVEKSAQPAVLNITPATGYSGSLYIPSKFYGDDPFQLIVPDHSNNVDPLLFSSSNLDVATVSSTGVVTVHNVGKSWITVSQAENANYSPTLSSTYEFEVFKATPTFDTFTIDPKVYLTAPFVLVPPNSSNLNVTSWTFTNSDPTVATIDPVTYMVTVLKVGSTFIQATQASDANHTTSVSNVATLQVTLASPTITFTTPSKTYTPNGTFTLAATSNSSGGKLFAVPSMNTVLSLAGNVATILNAGTTEITITQLALGSFAGKTLTVPFTVNKATPNFAFAVDTTSYKFISGGMILLDASSTNSTGLITYSSNNSVLTVDQNKAVMQGVGTGSVTALIAATTNYAERSVTNTFSVVAGKANLRNFSIDPKISTDDPFTLVAPISENEITPFTYDSLTNTIATVSGSTVSIVKAGTAVIRANQASSDLFEGSSVTTELIITRAVPELSFTVANQTFAENKLVALSVITPVVDAVITYTTASSNISIDNGAKRMTLMNAGNNITVTANLATSDKYDARSVSASFNIEKVSTPITFTVEDKLFVDNASFTLTASSLSSGIFIYTSTSPTISINGTVATMLDLGPAEITVTQLADVNYLESTQTVTFNIEQAAPTFTFPMPSVYQVQKFVADKTFPLNASSSNSLGEVSFSSSEPTVVSVIGTVAKHNSIGSSVITANLAATDSYFAASLTKTVVLQEGDLAPLLTPLFTFPMNNTDQNQFFTQQGVTFLLNASSLNSDGEITYTSDNSQAVSIAGNVATVNGVGSARIVATLAPTLVYDTRELSKIVNIYSQEFPVNTILQNFTVTGKTYLSNPFTIVAPTTNNNQTSIVYTSSNESVATVSGTTVTIVGAGATAITASQVATLNHNAGSISTNFIVYKATPTFSSNWSIPSKQVGAASFQLTYELTNLKSTNTVTPITYTSSNPNVATILNTTVTVVGAGSTTITASQASNINFNTPTPVFTTFTVTEPAPISNICFVAGTQVHTDQGCVKIQDLKPSYHTICNKSIIAVTKTKSLDTHLVCIPKDAFGLNVPSRDITLSQEHQVQFLERMLPAKDLVTMKKADMVPYTGETLYNVLLETHDKMVVHNLVCETLNPTNPSTTLHLLLSMLPLHVREEKVREFNAMCCREKMYAC